MPVQVTDGDGVKKVRWKRRFWDELRQAIATVLQLRPETF